MTDEELLQRTRLYTKDKATGETGYNLATVMLLGKDDVIADVVPAYVLHGDKNVTLMYNDVSLKKGA